VTAHSARVSGGTELKLTREFRRAQKAMKGKERWLLLSPVKICDPWHTRGKKASNLSRKNASEANLKAFRLATMIVKVEGGGYVCGRSAQTHGNPNAV